MRQVLLALLFFLLFLALVVLGLYISDRAAGPGRSARDESLRDFRGLGGGVDTGTLWLERSEAELEQLRENDKHLRLEMEKILARWQEEQEKLERLEQNLEHMESGWQLRNESIALAGALAGETAAVTLPPPDAVAGPPLLPEENLPPSAPFSPESFSGVSSSGVSSGDLSPLPAAAGDDFLLLEVNVAGVAPGASAAGGHASHRVAGYLPAGSFVTARLLTGLDAPTGGLARGNPIPVLLALADDGQLPNRFRHRVRECQVTAAGHGDLAAERAYLRLERFSCVLRDGQVLDLQIRGYVVGEDGKAGLRGRVVSKQGALIARSLVAGVAGGIGEGLSQSLTSISTNALGSVSSVEGGQLLQYGLARGAGNALDRIARWYLERAEEVYPVIEVASGRRVELVLTEGLELGADLLARAASPQGSPGFPRGGFSGAMPHEVFHGDSPRGDSRSFEKSWGRSP